MSEAWHKLASAATLMQRALTESTGLRDLQQKLVTYWALATHSLPSLDTFPLLVVQGKMGTGKSQALSVIGNFARRPMAMSLRSMTTPTIRDKFAECHNGTAIVEEADFAWRDDAGTTFERMLSDRYQRASSKESHKVQSGENKWNAVERQFFGATALHRRIPFKDSALDGRTVTAMTRPDYTRQYREFRTEDTWNAEGKRLLGGVIFELPDIEQPQGVAGRVFATYKPLLGAAKVCGHQDFADQLLIKLLQRTLELKEAQSSEPDGLVLQAIVGAVFESGNPKFQYVKFSGLSESIWKNHRFSLTPRQIGPIARDLGFATKTSHGATVVVPTPATLLRACDECDYTDEAVEEFRRTALGSMDGGK